MAVLPEMGRHIQKNIIWELPTRHLFVAEQSAHGYCCLCEVRSSLILRDDHLSGQLTRQFQQFGTVF